MKIIEPVKNYIVSEYTERALLITGGWGEGKTYFLENVVIPLIEKHGFRSIYVSLHGVSTIEQLESKFLAKLLPEKMQNKIYQNAVNVMSKKLLGSGMNEILKEVKWPKLENAILCFDDLERNKIDLDELWGFINYYVEQVKLKTIIISNEEEIGKEYYSKKKEKNIARTVAFSIEISSVLDKMLLKYKSVSPDFYGIVTPNKSYIVQLIDKYEIKNLRTISLFIENLRTVLNYSNQDIYWFKLVTNFTLIVTNEFSNGNITSKDLVSARGLKSIDRDFEMICLIRKSKAQEENKEYKKEYLELFFDKYVLEKQDDYIFFESIFEFIITGIIDSNKLSKETNLKPPENLPEHISVFDKLITNNFRKLSDKDFLNLLPELLNYMEKGQYNFYKYSVISNFLDFFRTNNLFLISEKDLKQKLFVGLNNAFNNSAYDQNAYDNIMAFGASQKMENYIRDEMKKLHDSLLDKKNKIKVVSLIESIKNKNEEEVLGLMEKNKFEPIFKNVVAKKLADILLGTTNEMLSHFDKSIYERYSIIGIGKFLGTEKDTMEGVRKILEQNVNMIDKDQPIRKFLLMNIAEAMEKAVEKLT